MENMHKLIVVLLNYMKYMKVPLDELLNYLLDDEDDEGKRQLCLLLDYESECLNEISCFGKNSSNNEFNNDFDFEL